MASSPFAFITILTTDTVNNTTSDEIAIGATNPCTASQNTSSIVNNNLLQQLDTLYDEFSHRKNWSTVIINDIAEKVAMGPFGSNIKVSTFVSEGVPIISGNHLRGYFLEEPSFNYITEEHAQCLKKFACLSKRYCFYSCRKYWTSCYDS